MNGEGAPHAVASIDSTYLAEYEQRYGRVLTPVEAVIVLKWNGLVGKHHSLLSYPDIPQKKLDIALQTYASGVTDELILGLQDTTTLGSGKEGVLFTTNGIFWKVAGTPTAMSVRYDELDPEGIASKQSFASGTLILSNKCRVPLYGQDESRMASLTAFVRDAIGATPSRLPDTCWESTSQSSIVDGKATSVSKYRSLEEVKNAITSHALQATMLYRKYEWKLGVKEADKGEWKPIGDDLYQELGLSKDAVVEAEKKWNRKILIILGGVSAVVLVGLVVGLWFLVGHAGTPQTAVGWGRVIGGTVGVIIGSVVMFRVHPVVGLITLAAGMMYVMKSCAGP